MILENIHSLWPEKQGIVIERNRTEDYYVFVHFLSSVKLKNGEEIKPGACIMYAPFSYRYFSAESEPLLHDWFHVYGNIKELAERYGLELNRIYYPKNDGDITAIIQELEVEALLDAPFFENLCALKIEELILKVVRSARQTLPVNLDTYERFLKLRSNLQTEYYNIRNVESLAPSVGLSPSRFYVLYKKIFGISPKQDLINIRVEHAKQLLCQKQYSIAEIAEMTGYLSPYHFIRQFKMQTKETPLQFSKKYTVGS